MVSWTDPFFIRNLVYGIEDSLLSTTGVVVGVALAGMSRPSVVITGSILTLVGALSMAFGAFVSEESFMKTAKLKYGVKNVLTYATVMFTAYAFAGLVPMLPFIVGVSGAWAYSIGLALLALWGLVMAVHRNVTKAATLAGIGGVVLGTSVLVGRALNASSMS